MFTGIIETTGKIQQISESQIEISCEKVLKGSQLGDSIAVNGVCLTIVKIKPDGFVADISPETYKVTALKMLKNSSYVNLERAMKADDRFGGHIVSGHVDGIGTIKTLDFNKNFYSLKIEVDKEQAKYAVKKGSITVDGISLTIANLADNLVEIAIIPHTFENTNLKYLKMGDYVNIETDILAKYVEKFLSTGNNESRIDLAFLAENGF